MVSVDDKIELRESDIKYFYFIRGILASEGLKILPRI